MVRSDGWESGHTRLRHRQAGQLHELVDGEGAVAHELLVERGSGLGGEGLLVSIMVYWFADLGFGIFPAPD